MSPWERMSALGQKQTYAVQKGMSALPSIATSNATYGVSAKGQWRRTCIEQPFVFDFLAQLDRTPESNEVAPQFTSRTERCVSCYSLTEAVYASGFRLCLPSALESRRSLREILVATLVAEFAHIRKSVTIGLKSAPCCVHVAWSRRRSLAMVEIA